MNTPHERLTRTTFSLPFGEVHALVGGAVNARPLLFLHGFPDHPPTAVPFLEHLAETHRVVAPWLRGYAPSPIVGPYDLDTLAADAIALIDRLGGQVDLVGHDWGGAITYTVCAAAPSHVRLAATLAIPHPATLLRSLAHSKQWKKSWYMGLLQLPGNDDGCIVPPTDEDRRLFDARVLEVMPNLGHFLHVEAPTTIAARVARWLA